MQHWRKHIKGDKGFGTRQDLCSSRLTGSERKCEGLDRKKSPLGCVYGGRGREEKAYAQFSMWSVGAEQFTRWGDAIFFYSPLWGTLVPSEPQAHTPSCVWKGEMGEDKLGEDTGKVTSQDLQDDLKVWTQVQVHSYLGQLSWYVSGRHCQCPPSSLALMFLAWQLDNFHLWAGGLRSSFLHGSSLLPALTGGRATHCRPLHLHWALQWKVMFSTMC